MGKPIIINGEKREERRQGERRKNNNKLAYKITWGGILLLATFIFWLVVSKGQTENKIEKVQNGYTEIKTEISAIRTDIEWIKNYLEEMRRR